MFRGSYNGPCLTPELVRKEGGKKGQETCYFVP